MIFKYLIATKIAPKKMMVRKGQTNIVNSSSTPNLRSGQASINLNQVPYAISINTINPKRLKTRWKRLAPKGLFFESGSMNISAHVKRPSWSECANCKKTDPTKVYPAISGTPRRGKSNIPLDITSAQIKNIRLNIQMLPMLLVTEIKRVNKREKD